MENREKLEKAFRDALGVGAGDVHDALAYGSKSWDSVAHMALIAAIETAFDIMIDTEDVVEMSSFAKAKTIVGKYGVSLQA